MSVRAASAWLAAVLALVGLMILAPLTAAAGPTRLNQGTVSPTTGVTTTSFAFSVHYVGRPTTNETASSVTAVASNGSATRTTVLLLGTGTTLDGTWTGANTLPAGTWTVIFNAVSSLGNELNLEFAGSIVVTAPTPTPAPTAAPTPPPPPPTATPRPTLRPTSVPATVTPVPRTSVTAAVSPTPFGTTVTDPGGSPPGSAQPGNPTASPSPSPSSGTEAPGPRPFNVPIEGVVAIGLLGAVTVAAALGERRRRAAVQAFREAEAAEGAARGEGLDEGWEDDVVEDETVATIDYEGPAD